MTKPQPSDNGHKWVKFKEVYTICAYCKRLQPRKSTGPCSGEPRKTKAYREFESAQNAELMRALVGKEQSHG
jgi:hypothetical protein